MEVNSCAKCNKLLDKPVEPLKLDDDIHETVYCEDCWSDFMAFMKIMTAGYTICSDEGKGEQK